MGTTKKQKRAFRVRQKVAQRPPSKMAQLRMLMDQIESYEDNVMLGRIRNQSTKENNEGT